ncbi:TPA: hypothetical protein OTY28_005191 [Pseudomonas aeruginosa]|nr:hypothetical protein [Pseudomonas aeruginosa]
MSKVQRFWCDEARNIRCVREDDFDALAAEAQALREEVAALRARVVVVPERAVRNSHSGRSKAYVATEHWNEGFNDCLDELARLNGLTVSEGLLRRLVDFAAAHPSGKGLAAEVGALLDEIDGLKAENDRLRQGMKGDYDIDAWLDWSKEKEQIKAQNEALRGALHAVQAEVDGNLRPLTRDLVNMVSGLNNGSHPNDIYDHCDEIERIIGAALEGATK